MSKKPLREDHTCQNCGSTVNERYCPKCGQENIETRQTFGHLVTEFAHDFTHYEGKFWTTLKHLLFSPARLTREYLSGKRHSSVPPIRLYIFISFVAFLLPHLLPDSEPQMSEQLIASRQAALDTLNANRHEGIMYSPSGDLILNERHATEAEYDLMLDTLTESEKPSAFSDWLHRRSIALQHYTPEELWAKLTEAVQRSLPKALFLYMPMFALGIWIFHSRRKWMYFDHAIFTLHYFSMILFVYAFLEVFESPVRSYFHPETASTVYTIGANVMVLFYLTYFFIAHKRMFGERGWISFLKSLGILVLNGALFLVVFSGVLLYAFSVMH